MYQGVDCDLDVLRAKNSSELEFKVVELASGRKIMYCGVSNVVSTNGEKRVLAQVYIKREVING